MVNYFESYVRYKEKYESLKLEHLKLLVGGRYNGIFEFSDHAPIKGECYVDFGDGTKFKLKSGSYNVLYQRWLNFNAKPNGHIHKYFPHLVNLNEQNRINGSIDYILFMLKDGIDILGIQEAGKLFAEMLWKKINRSKYGVIYPWTLNLSNGKRPTDNKNNVDDFQMIIYDKSKFDHKIKNSHLEYYDQQNNKKRIMNIAFSKKNTKKIFRFINTHVEHKQIKVLEYYLNNIKKGKLKQLPVVVVGDMNIKNIQTLLNNIMGYKGIPVHTNVIIRASKGNLYFGKTQNTHIDTYGNNEIYDYILCLSKL